MSIKGRVAIILSGLGYKTGSEIHETVLSFLALSQNGFSYQCFARDLDLEASKPLARDAIESINRLHSKDFDALWFPGGAGAIKHLCNFFEEPKNFNLDPQVKRVISGFHQEKKPIVAMCIAPVVVAKFFEGKGLNLTLGSDLNQSNLLKELGHIPNLKNADDFCYDKEYNVYSTPAYMEKTNVGQIYTGLLKIVERL
jgi:enhancing lycopene biosynthesis protein 2